MGKMLSKVHKFATKPLRSIPLVGKTLHKQGQKVHDRATKRGKKDTRTALHDVGFK